MTTDRATGRQVVEGLLMVSVEVAPDRCCQFRAMSILQFHVLTALGSILRILFCSGLDAPLIRPSSTAYGTFSSADWRTLLVPPDGRGGFGSFPASEAMLLFTLDVGVGEAGFTAPLTMPLSVGICEAEAWAVGPSAERMSRVADGKAFGLGFFCLLLLKRKDILGRCGR
jgi:hypothetical protein